MFLTENISFDYYYNKDLIIDDSCKFFLLFYDILTDYYLFLNFYPFYYFIFTLD